MNIKRIFKRILEEIRATLLIANVTSYSKAISTLIGKVSLQIIAHNGHKESQWLQNRLKKKHQVMNEYFFKTFKNYYLDKDCFKVPKQNEKFKDCIWTCWWQGLDNAPDVVKICINSIQKFSSNHKLIIITENNYKNYITFPDYIENKRKNGIISRTHFSDILRLYLLSTYGGLWLDSTFFCTGDLEYCFNGKIWSIKRPGYTQTSVAAGYFANYSMGCSSEYRFVFASILNYLLYYWKNNDILIDYLFLDYLIVLAQRMDNDILNLFMQIETNNENCDELIKIINCIYDEKKWNFIKQNTNLFKLSWKNKFRKEKCKSKTFYGKMSDYEL